MTKEDLKNYIDRFYQPKQVLFLSADLVGSTALKQKRREKSKGSGVLTPDTKPWSDAIQGLYSQTAAQLSARWEGEFKDRLGSPPILWKTIGDEVVYRKLISKVSEVTYTLEAWCDAIREVEELIRASSKVEQLQIKCTAWIAEFPIQNRVLIGGQLKDALQYGDSVELNLLQKVSEFERNPVRDGLEIDFVGPAIDVGFRLSKLSSARRFVISIDVAYLILIYGNVISAGGGIPFRLRFHGSESLPGVIGGVPYPIFWIDMASDASTDNLADKMYGEQHLNIHNAKSFCERFYEEKINFVDHPFIVTEDLGKVGKIKINQPPKWYIARLKQEKSEMARRLANSHVPIEQDD
jgi:hypothetical protein